mmetsp:Transcript_101832/g.328627  ORF Transcript_101832/g.328627 Transcript_101832/m.328627 type:complete len:192 (+) Transcript_101832:156-731(+)
MSGFRGGGPGGFAQCAAHGKRRSLESLADNGAGGFVCTPDSECQMSANDVGPQARGQCSLHGKTRSLDCLTDDGNGGLSCTPDQRCKDAGEMPQRWARWGQGGWGQPSGPNLPRKRLTEVPIMGKVLEWKGKYGWVAPESPVDHPKASRHGGKIYVSSQDVIGAAELMEGAAVQFHIYEDASGLGAEECIG